VGGAGRRVKGHRGGPNRVPPARSACPGASFGRATRAHALPDRQPPFFPLAAVSGPGWARDEVHPGLGPPSRSRTAHLRVIGHLYSIASSACVGHRGSFSGGIRNGDHTVRATTPGIPGWISSALHLPHGSRSGAPALLSGLSARSLAVASMGLQAAVPTSSSNNCRTRRSISPRIGRTAHRIPRRCPDRATVRRSLSTRPGSGTTSTQPSRRGPLCDRDHRRRVADLAAARPHSPPLLLEHPTRLRIPGGT
jgi:hypothetical protein